ncbi:YkgJ family cysteine cluster protein [Mucisphaera calidilacus]|uniref:Flagellin N-methylase n=1 Tax=Mucisphaera calidilacus TaxID=2527982 RepID=A0A518BW99_9BACT|nr:YkgJ family cysteine cluster protein [Mucisphaera calidilacus]QDU71231.1 Flagellin N-methylase [Mucisphaera calidilacus]
MTQVEQEAEWFDPGLSFGCTQCGNCCTGPTGFVWFTPEEGQAIAKELGIDVETFKTEYAVKKMGRWSLAEVKRGHLYDCVFLTWNEDHTKAGCSIYNVRPTQCRTWPFWPSNLKSQIGWDLAARHCPGMRLGGQFVPSDQIRIQRDRSDPRL